MRMPILFIGHGNPMYAIQENEFTRTLERLGRILPSPRAILCVSAHWQTEGSWVTHMKSPRTIHDFYGFPPDLYAVRYPAPGSAEIAELVRKTVTDPKVQLDDEIWGLDHGSWAVLKHLYPEAKIPVVQLSIDLSRPLEFHFEIGRQLAKLRDRGILLIGSGNIVHNLREMNWKGDAKPYDWAVEFDEWVKGKLLKRDFSPLMTDLAKSLASQWSVPTLDHYIPLFYTLGASLPDDPLRFEYEGIDNSSISMRTVSFGRHD